MNECCRTHGCPLGANGDSCSTDRRVRLRRGMGIASISFWTILLVASTNVASQEKQENRAEIREEPSGEDGGSEEPILNSEPEESPPSELQDGQQASQPTIEPKRVKAVIFNVFIESDPAILNSILEALKAQLSDVDVRLVFNGGVFESSELRNLIERGKTIAQPQDAVGVFWLDVNHGESWLLYLVDPAGERVLVRRAGPGLESLTATVEAIAVITRNSTKALLEGQTIGLQAAEKKDDKGDDWMEIHPGLKPATGSSDTANEVDTRDRDTRFKPRNQRDRAEKPQSYSTKSGQARFAAAYRGTTFAQQKPWQSGIAIWAGWITEFGLIAGIGYLWTPGTNIATDLYGNEGVVEFRVERDPFELFAGYQYRLGVLAFEGELGVILDSIARRSQPVSSQRGLDRLLTETPDQSGIAFALLSRARVEYFLERHVGLFIALGLEVFIRNFAYVAELEGSRITLLDPNPGRFDLEIGLAFHL
ncbi:MAG: hypothetical protein JXA30_06575 [Deltaproteobacteria bacterium]|nr:hypothetical protein [Deltaproteobacteria bacterium]